MSDNTTIQKPTTNGDIISTEDIGGGVKLPRSKIVLGNHDVDGGDVTPSNPFPVTITNTPTVTVSGTSNVAITNSPTVAISGTPNVAITNTPTVNVNNTSHDTIASSKYQIIKLLAGTTGADEGLVSSSNPMPINIINTPNVSVNNTSYDTVSSSNYQVIKILSGNSGGNEGLVSSSNPMPVNVINFESDINVAPLGTESFGSSFAQRVKLVIGDFGSDNGDVAKANPLPILASPVTISSGDSFQGSSLNASAVISYSGSDGILQVIGGIGWSYSGTGTMAGQLTIEDQSENIVFQVDITDTGPGFIPFNPPITTGSGNSMVVTLAGGGSSITGKVNVLSHWAINVGD